LSHALLHVSMAAATPDLYSLSLHDALPISTEVASTEATSTENLGTPNPWGEPGDGVAPVERTEPLPDRPSPPPSLTGPRATGARSEEHTSELQSRENLVCRLLLEKKKK